MDPTKEAKNVNFPVFYVTFMLLRGVNFVGSDLMNIIFRSDDCTQVASNRQRQRMPQLPQHAQLSQHLQP
jgi:hypothetical protein